MVELVIAMVVIVMSCALLTSMVNLMDFDMGGIRDPGRLREDLDVWWRLVARD